MQAIPSCRQEHVRPYLHFLKSIGAPVERALNRNRLPATQAEVPNVYLPLSPVVQFLESMNDSQGIDEFGLRAVGNLRIEDLGAYFVARARNAPTLLAALIHFQRLVPLEDTNTFVWMSPREHDIRLSISSRYPFNEFGLALEDRHLLVTLIAVVRGFAGPGWVPAEIGFHSPHSVTAYAIDCFPDTRFHSRQGATWISVPREMLSLPPSFGTINQVSTQQDSRLQEQPLDFTKSLKQIVASYLRDRYLSVEFIASIADLSPRTLQRRLQHCGTSYSELVLQTRYEAASIMLHDHDRRITNIAYDLGYRDPAHFTRAFGKVAGVSPRGFRRQIQPSGQRSQLVS